jgi:hypothetical protein
MTRLGGQTFNYSFFNTSTIGEYKFTWDNPCVDCSNGDCGNNFFITPNGDGFDISQAIIYIILIVTNLILLAITLYYSITLPFFNKSQKGKNGNEVTEIIKLKYVKIMVIWVSYALYMWFISILTGLVNNYITFLPLKTMFTNLYLFSILLQYGVNMGMIGFIIFLSWKDIIINKEIVKYGSSITGGNND